MELTSKPSNAKQPNCLAISNALPSIIYIRMNHEALPYWLVNVPQSQWPAECPDFLINANAKDRGILSTPNANYHRQTWPEVQEIISTTPSPSHHIAPNSSKSPTVLIFSNARHPTYVGTLGILRSSRKSMAL